MFPIQNHTVAIVLQYISPPSQLDQPLPAHIISNSLRQRHALLHISPNDPLDYLCWPSPQNSTAIELLESLNASAVDGEEGGVFPATYTSDSQHSYAHVRVGTDIRLIFEWDDTDGWKYHDLQLMPFPTDACASLAEVLSRSSASEPLAKRSNGNIYDTHDLGDADEDPEDEDYWNSYGVPESDPNSPRQFSRKEVTTEPKTEDAYWAQYGTVHGSADSTIPSPAPMKNRKLAQSRDSYHSAHQDDNLDNSLPASRPRSQLGHNLGVLSPNTLTHLLGAVSPRKDIFLSPAFPEPDFKSLPDASPVPNSARLQGLTPVHDRQTASIVLPRVARLDSLPILAVAADENSQNQNTEAEAAAHFGEQALRDTIRGTYHLWRAHRRSQLSVSDPVAEQEFFLRIVRDVTGQL